MAAPTALITGASRGIGLAIARALAPSYALVLSARDPQRLQQAAEQLASDCIHGVRSVPADLAERAAVAELIAQAGAVSVLVNNAGLASSAPLAKTDDELWARTFRINVEAPFELIRGLVPGMRKLGGGRIVNVASTAALKGYPYTAAYSASKAALLGLSRALAVELAQKGITVNAVCPGFVDTDIVRDAVANIVATTGRDAEQARASLERFNPQGRLLSPEEVATLVAYLCSDAARSVTGRAHVIDGGETA